jgi:hypothetical protein
MPRAASSGSRWIRSVSSIASLGPHPGSSRPGPERSCSVGAMIPVIPSGADSWLNPPSMIQSRENPKCGVSDPPGVGGQQRFHQAIGNFGQDQHKVSSETTQSAGNARTCVEESANERVPEVVVLPAEADAGEERLPAAHASKGAHIRLLESDL